jgi:simple sugar transport system ATP-binding protein
VSQAGATPEGGSRPGGSGRLDGGGERAASARLTGIVRRFGRVLALDGAELDVRPAEVHAVLGENGAGKSTLLGILGGMLRPDEGRVEIGGSEVVLRSPRDAWARGVGLVHQHFTLVPALTVLENLALGQRSAAGGWRIPYERVRRTALDLMRRTGLEVRLDGRVEELGVGERQRIEILKTLLRDPPVLALDEPTAVLTPGEVESLFTLLRSLAVEGRAVILVAHKIDEVLSVADRVTVLRHGRTVLSAARGEVDAPTLIAALVGDDRHVDDAVETTGRPAVRSGEPIATLEDVIVHDTSGRRALDGVSLGVHRGEIVGVAGVEGNGQRELALVLAGRRPPDEGTARLPAGIGFIPQDRAREGLIGDFDLVENVALALHDDDRFGRGPLLDWGKVRMRAEEVRSRFGIRAPGVDTVARALSGGNQQRLVVGRELALASDLLVAENPTRGLDVAATAFVHAELRRLTRAERGPGVVLVSTDLDEVLKLADRMLVMTRGRLVAVPAKHPTREEIGRLMLGGASEVA